jgi:hypothetical protein
VVSTGSSIWTVRDTNSAAADYIKLYNGDRATLSASLQFIQFTAAEILTALDVDTGGTSQLLLRESGSGSLS